MEECQLEGCTGKFFKSNGFFKLGKWFCKEQCGEKDPDIKDVAELYEKGIEFDNHNKINESDESDVEIDL